MKMVVAVREKRGTANTLILLLLLVLVLVEHGLLSSVNSSSAYATVRTIYDHKNM